MKNDEMVSAVSDCLNGNQDSFLKIVNHFQRQVYAISYHFSHSPQEAEDAAADVFIKAFQALRSYNHKFSFSSWLYKIAFHHLVGKFRKKKREKNHIQAEISHGSTISEHNTPESLYFQRVEKHTLRKALDLIAVEYRTALLLRFYHDLSYSQIGEIMGISKNTVGSLILRGKRELRKKWHEENIK